MRRLCLSIALLVSRVAGKWSLPHCISRCATGGASSSGHGGLLRDHDHHVDNPRLIPPNSRPWIVVTPGARAEDRVELTGGASGEPIDVYNLVRPPMRLVNGLEHTLLIPIEHAPWGLFAYARFTFRRFQGDIFNAGIDVDAHRLAQQFHAANPGQWIRQYRMEIQVWQVRTRIRRSNGVREATSWTTALRHTLHPDRSPFDWVDANGRSDREAIGYVNRVDNLQPGQFYITVRWRLAYEVGNEPPAWFVAPGGNYRGWVLGHPIQPGSTVQGRPRTWPAIEDPRPIPAPGDQQDAPPPSGSR